MFKNYIPAIAAGLSLMMVLSLVPVANQKASISEANSIVTSCVAPASGMTNWWDADSVEGDKAKDKAGAADGIIKGVGGTTEGKVGKAFQFNGNEFVQLPKNFFPYPTSQRGNTPFSIDLWFKTTDAGVIFGQQGMAPFDNMPNLPPWNFSRSWVPAIFVKTDGLLSIEMFLDPHSPIVSQTAVKDGQWHHIGVVYDGTNESAYLDGSLIGITEKAQDPFAGGQYNYQIGTGISEGRAGGKAGVWKNLGFGIKQAEGNWWDSFKGAIDEVSIYNRALSPDEVKAIYNAGSAGKCKLECGNNLIQPGEICDGTNVSGKTCETQLGQGYMGALGCANDCQIYDTSNCTPPTQCSDGKDNDGDGKIDYPSDPGCENADDDDEAAPLVKREIKVGKNNKPQILTQPSLKEREVLQFSTSCTTCTITSSPDHAQYIGGTALTDKGFSIMVNLEDSSDGSISYTIVAVGDVVVDTQLFTSDGKQYTNIQQ